MRSFFTPEDGPNVSKHEGNKHQRSAGCVMDYLLYTKQHTAKSTLQNVTTRTTNALQTPTHRKKKRFIRTYKPEYKARHF